MIINNVMLLFGMVFLLDGTMARMMMLAWPDAY